MAVAGAGVRTHGASMRNQRARHASIWATSNAAAARAITHTNVAMDGWSARMHSTSAADTPDTPSQRSLRRVVAGGTQPHACAACAGIDNASHPMPAVLESSAASRSHAVDVDSCMRGLHA